MREPTGPLPAENNSLSGFGLFSTVVLATVFVVWRTRLLVHALPLLAGSGRMALLGIAVLVLVLALEAYVFVALGLACLRKVWPLQRRPVPLPADLRAWPEVDLIIRSGASLEAVTLTALSSVRLDWPRDRLHLHVVDDVYREEVQAFCAGFGFGYRVWDEPSPAGATRFHGALHGLIAPFAAVFEAGDVPVRSFLQVTMGWFVQDPQLASLQARCVLPASGSTPQEATPVSGAPVILRRAALDALAASATRGFAAGIRSSLRLHRRGWHTAYLQVPQAARVIGLPTRHTLDAANQHAERRRAVRLPLQELSEVLAADGTSSRATFVDASSGGVKLRMPGKVDVSAGEDVTLHFAVLGDAVRMPATILEVAHGELRLQFHPATVSAQDHLAILLYTRADAWLHLERKREESSPGRINRGWRWAPPLLLVILLILPWRLVWLARGLNRNNHKAAGVRTITGNPAPNRGPMPEVQQSVALEALPAGRPLSLSGRTSWVAQDFTIPQNEMAQRAVLQLHYRSGPPLRSPRGYLLVLLNDTPVAQISVGAEIAEENRAGMPVLLTSIDLPPELLVSQDRLVLRLEKSDTPCSRPPCPAPWTPWVQVMPGTSLLLTATPLIPSRTAGRPSVP